MNFNRVVMILLVVMLLPSMVFAQAAPPPATRATFEVRKDFSDENLDATVLVSLNCNTGLPISQSQTIGHSVEAYKDEAVIFVVESFEDGALNCTVSEDGVDGYTADFDLCGDDSDGKFLDVSDGDTNGCTIINNPTPIEVTVTKDWEVEGSGGDSLDPTYSLTLWCDHDIVGGTACENGVPVKEGGNYDEQCYYYGGADSWYKELTLSGTGNTNDEDYTAHVVPEWEDGTYCWVNEQVYDSSVEVDDSDCSSSGDILVYLAGAGDNECTIVNTVFFEGIPTLSQYGMAIMALLMLGVGFVGFRRFV